MTSNTPAPAEPAQWFPWRYAEGLAPVVIVWLVLVGWLVSLLLDRANYSDQSDEAVVREWLDETRIFRKALPELMREYAAVRAAKPGANPDVLRLKEAELTEHMRSLAEPTRIYLNQLPGFPVVYRLEVEFSPIRDIPDVPEKLAWVSPLPHPRPQSQNRVRILEYHPQSVEDPSAVIRCEYQLHAFNKLQQQETERQRESLVAAAVLVAATLLAALFVVQFLRRERAREVQRLTALTEAEHRQRELAESERERLAIQVKQQEAEIEREDLDRRLLVQKLEAADLEKRANEAEKSALELKSQMFAGIGIMAASYAHNIKNLLVRPNARLDEFLQSESAAGSGERLREVKDDLRTVTERLERILATVRRDPGKSEITRVDLARLVKDVSATWSAMAADKWKVRITCAVPAEPIFVKGDLSHLQQAIENLIFNARDATFEMRNALRDEARKSDPSDRDAIRSRLLGAAGWRGHIALSLHTEGPNAVLEIQDNGIGMTPEVLENCRKPHFTTKRNNALLEGHSAGLGLGLSFVAVVLEHHGATLRIESMPQKGATFHIVMPMVE